jgi:hypothetical protein
VSRAVVGCMGGSSKEEEEEEDEEEEDGWMREDVDTLLSVGSGAAAAAGNDDGDDDDASGVAEVEESGTCAWLAACIAMPADPTPACPSTLPDCRLSIPTSAAPVVVADSAQCLISSSPASSMLSMVAIVNNEARRLGLVRSSSSWRWLLLQGPSSFTLPSSLCSGLLDTICSVTVPVPVPMTQQQHQQQQSQQESQLMSVSKAWRILCSEQPATSQEQVCKVRIYT